jgi:putative endonuclease
MSPVRDIMVYVYILRSQKDNRLYTGSTNDLRKRFREHSEGKVYSTKSYYEACLNDHDARVREKYHRNGYIKNRLKRFLSLTG